MQSLKDKVSVRKVKEALTQLPRGSGSAASKIAYDETMSRIRRQGRGFCDLAIATLSWISLAIRPLSLRELKCALSVEPGDTELDEANFVDEETLSSVCAGLVVVDQESQIVRLAHYTTQEYFESQKDVLFLDGQKLLATTCLTYLSFDMFSNWQSGCVVPYFGNSKPPLKSGTTLYDYHLLNYAATHWHEHTYFSHDITVQGLLVKYLKRTENLAALLCPGDWYRVGEDMQSIHGLLIAARYGFTDAVKALLHLEGYCAEERRRIKAQALDLAVLYRQSSALRVLLDDNKIASAAVSRALSNVYIRDGALSGRCEVAEILLNHGADANTNLYGIPLIHHACDRNDVEFASLLLLHGADVELREWTGRTALHEAAEEGHSGDIIKVLLENGVDINAIDNNCRTALLVAMKNPNSSECERVVKQLLESGASVTPSDVYGFTALHWAASDGRVKIACQLLEAGADIDARNYDGETAADHLYGWDWDSMTEEERAECKEILEKYSFSQGGEERAVQDTVLFDWEPITLALEDED